MHKFVCVCWQNWIYQRKKKCNRFSSSELFEGPSLKLRWINKYHSNIWFPLVDWCISQISLWIVHTSNTRTLSIRCAATHCRLMIIHHKIVIEYIFHFNSPRALCSAYGFRSLQTRLCKLCFAAQHIGTIKNVANLITLFGPLWAFVWVTEREKKTRPNVLHSDRSQMVCPRPSFAIVTNSCVCVCVSVAQKPNTVIHLMKNDMCNRMGSHAFIILFPCDWGYRETQNVNGNGRADKRENGTVSCIA